MQSIASIVTADNSFDIGIIADIDNDDSGDENHRAVSSVADSESNLTVSELASLVEETFGHDSSAHGILPTELHIFVLRLTVKLTLQSGWGPHIYAVVHSPMPNATLPFPTKLCLFFCCNFVQLQISPVRIKLATSNFARWFIDVLCRNLPFWGPLLPHNV